MTKHNLEDDGASNPASPAGVYAARLDHLRKLQSEEQHRERVLGYSKLALAVLTVGAGLFFHRELNVLLLLLIPVAAFMVLTVRQEKLLVAIRYRTRAIDFYQRGLDRLQDRWAGSGETGERFLHPEHPYARDLDLFGKASLFEYLSSARTRAGEETLVHWLLAGAAPEEIRSRQAAVGELRERVGFREALFAAGETVRLGVHPESLSAWGEAQPVFTDARLRVLVSVLAAAWVFSLIAWAMWNMPVAALLMTVLNFAYSHRIHARLEKAAGELERAAQDLELLREVLAVLEKEEVSSPRLVALREVLQHHGIAPSAAIAKLERTVQLLESRHSLFARPLDLVTFWSTQLVFMAAKWQREFGPAIRGWMAAVGEFEALTSLSAFAYEHPHYAFPEIVPGGALFEAEELAHPLLPGDKAIANSVKLGDPVRLMILSGPNMAGKSTFIRALGVNAVLAQCGAPVCARRLRMSPLHVAASICILDSLAGGMSRFYAEIHRMKVIADLAQGSVPVFFLLDELLSGTNSHDRLAGTQFVLRNLLERGAIGIVSTHDLALTQIPAALDGKAINSHFEDRLENDRLVFDYRLKPGIVQTSNALKLMQAIGLGEPADAEIKHVGPPPL